MKTFKRIEQVPSDEENSVSKEVSENPENTKEIENSKETETSSIEETSSSNAESTSINDLLGDVPSVTLPDSDVAQSLEPVELGEENASKNGPIDTDGEHFNPEKHLANEDGSPRISDKTGKLLKKRGRKRAADSNGYLDGEVNNSEAKAVAETYFQGFKLLGSALVGGDFATHTKPEGEMITKAIEAVCIESNSTGLTPKQMLGVALMSYTAPRITTPTARERMGVLWYRFKKLLKKKNPKEAIEAEDIS